ncbi:ArsR/SmtB family transcription factor [Flindersiella endophytica]
MIVVDVDSASLARLRLAPSPAYELAGWLLLAAQGRRHPVYGDPGPAARAALRRADTQLVAELFPRSGRGYTPDFLTPAPPPVARPARTFGVQLELVAATPADAVEREIGWFAAEGQLSARVREAVQAGTLAGRVAAGLYAFWRAAFADSWSALRATLDADIRRRGTELAQAGVGAVLGGLHPDLRWTGGRLEITSAYDEHHAVGQADLVLAPSAIRWPGLGVQLHDARAAVFCYPAGGVGAPAADRNQAAAVADLLGASRAALLRDLDEPRSTGDLSRRHVLAPATVSHHLGVMLRAGLVHRDRSGRVVYYRRSLRGDALVS